LNTNKNIVIIGCGAGGGTAAQFARKTDRKAHITVFEKGKYPQYSKCGLPYVISGDISEIDDLIEFDEEWFKKANIDLFLGTTVEKIDTDKKIITAKKGNQLIEKKYDSLIFCTGAKPSIPNIKNIDVDGVFALRSIDDAKKIIENIQKGKNAVIFGAGLIGLEMADSLFNKGMKVTIVEALGSILPNNLDSDMAKIISEQIPRDIDIFTNHKVTMVEDKNNQISKVLIKDNKTNMEKILEVDLLIIATGTSPTIELAKSVGCKIGNLSGIVVNTKSETSLKNIYAVGDCTQITDFINAKQTLVGLGSIAVRQGIAAGINSAGENYELLKGALGTTTSKVFGVEFASVGPITDKLSDFTTVYGRFNGFSLPDYFPGGKPVSIKVNVDKYTGMIMSAQCVGDKAAERINTFACAIIGELDIETFRKLETAYAPPVAPTLDVVTLVCDIISMKLNRKH